MGLFDSISNTVLGKFMGGTQGNVAGIATELLNEHGGLSGLLDKFKKGGLGDVALSWVGKGENLPITAEQVSSILGNSTIANLAEKFGVSPETMSAQLAEHLPAIVDKVTPSGEVNAGANVNLTSILSSLMK